MIEGFILPAMNQKLRIDQDVASGSLNGFGCCMG
jgi:hypothetical protein